MALFHADSLTLVYSNVEAARRWWVDTFDCRPVKVPPDWDDPRPSDVALCLPGDSDPTILLSDKAEAHAPGDNHPILFCGNLGKAHQHLRNRGVSPGSIKDQGGTEYFEIRDLEGNIIEVCKEP